MKAGAEEAPLGTGAGIVIRRALGDDERIGEDAAELRQGIRVRAFRVSGVAHVLRGKLVIPPQHEGLTASRNAFRRQLLYLGLKSLAHTQNEIAQPLAFASRLVSLT